jgi:glutamate-1-semialdehyde 2,1-aminomutase
MQTSTREYGQSEALDGRARRRLPGGVNSNVRLSARRRFFSRAEGAWLWDVDGNDYVDYVLGQGPAFLGHAHPDVTRAVSAASELGLVFGAQHPLEVEAAELFCDVVGWPEMVRFGVSGTEAVQGALRLARAARGRNKIVTFDGQYHGWLDNVLVGGDKAFGAVPLSVGQDPYAFADTIVLPWNDIAAVRDVFAAHGGEIAAIITEPMMCNSGALLPEPGFLQALRDVCDDSGALLIFDEVISGFRLALGGAAEFFGVTPDLATYGKALAGGWPVAAIAGRGELMERFGTAEVVHAGTFNGSTMACAAVAAALEVLRTDPPYERIDVHGRALMDGLAAAADAYDTPVAVQGLPVAFHVAIADGTPAGGYVPLAMALVDCGVWVASRGIWYVSAAHGDAELRAALDRVDQAFAAHRRGAEVAAQPSAR